MFFFSLPPWSSQHIHELPLVLIFGIATSPMIIHSLLPHSVSSLLCIELFQSLSSKEHLSTIIDKVIAFLNRRSVCVFKHSVRVWPLKVGWSEAFEMESVPESCGFGIFLLIAAEQFDTESFLLTLRHTHTAAFIFHLHWHLCIHTWAITLWHSHLFIKVVLWFEFYFIPEKDSFKHRKNSVQPDFCWLKN